ncbi:MAG TPA: squalene/phytoene synthase family protein [Anaerolineales bacterium]|nr:squalene/phytoene synthase family protein [Anaerolineales bacterium]
MLITPAAVITKAASKQAYYTIRFLADRERADDAYRAYGYFRWVDDIVDSGFDSNSERSAFLERQKVLLDGCYRGERMQAATAEENMLIQLVQHDHEKCSGLQVYLRNMMKVMQFDAGRRGRLISQVELDRYTHQLSCAVTEAMHYFIGHDDFAPHTQSRYLAVAGAHIVHMLRDAYEDLQMGYYNIPREVLESGQIRPQDIQSRAYRAWVQSRIQLARMYFRAGKRQIAQIENMRCRLAGYAYVARFEWVLNTIEREAYVLRPDYSDRKSFKAKYRMGLLAVSSIFNSKSRLLIYQPARSQLWRKR